MVYGDVIVLILVVGGILTALTVALFRTAVSASAARKTRKENTQLIQAKEDLKFTRDAYRELYQKHQGANGILEKVVLATWKKDETGWYTIRFSPDQANEIIEFINN